jgi:hypothetical protein
MGESDFNKAKKEQTYLAGVILAVFFIVMLFSIVGSIAELTSDITDIKIVYGCRIIAYVCLYPISWAICKLIRDNDKNKDNYNTNNPTHYKFDSTEDYQDIEHPFIICVIILIVVALFLAIIAYSYYMKN